MRLKCTGDVGVIYWTITVYTVYRLGVHCTLYSTLHTVKCTSDAGNSTTENVSGKKGNTIGLSLIL